MDGEGCIGVIIVLLVLMFMLDWFGNFLRSIPGEVWGVLGAIVGVGALAMLLHYIFRHVGLNDTAKKGQLVTRDDPPMQMTQQEAVARALAEHRKIQESTRKVDEALAARAALVNPTAAQVAAIRRTLDPAQAVVYDRKWRLLLDDLDTTRKPHEQSRPPTPAELRERLRRFNG